MAAYTTIDDAGLYFNPVIYTGTGSSNARTGVGFQPDLTWIKNRDVADFHVWTDAVRGATKYLKTNTYTSVNVTDVESLKSFDSDGFTVGTMNEVNTNTEKFVAWNWKAGTTTGIAGSPSITPTSYSFNQTAGFSIIKYVGNATLGATIPHGLSAAPEFVICKSTTATEAWSTGHQGLNEGTTPWNYAVALSSTNDEYPSISYWNNTAPSSTLVTLGNGGGQNYNGATVMAYCFTPIQGFSKFGRYTGNGNVDGTFIYTGFRPAFVMCKQAGTVSSSSWMLYDSKREGINEENAYLEPNSTQEEYLTVDIDILSNGFKLRDTAASVNNSAGSYVYIAFAEAPFVNSSGVPVNAR